MTMSELIYETNVEKVCKCFLLCAATVLFSCHQIKGEDCRKSIYNKYCKSLEFGKQSCYALFQHCDGVNECKDGTDELNCLTCASGQRMCRNKQSCYDITKKCDKTYDCPDGSDEAGCRYNSWPNDGRDSSGSDVRSELMFVIPIVCTIVIALIILGCICVIYRIVKNNRAQNMASCRPQVPPTSTQPSGGATSLSLPTTYVSTSGSGQQQNAAGGINPAVQYHPMSAQSEPQKTGVGYDKSPLPYTYTSLPEAPPPSYDQVVFRNEK